MKKNTPALLINTSAVGDVLCATPTIRKMAEVYQSKVFVISGNPEVLKNNPHISENKHFSEVNIPEIKQNYDLQSTFDMLGKRDTRGVEFKHAMCDIRQFHAKDLGFMLRPDELHCEFHPTEGSDSFLSDLSIPERYVVIHPVQSWESRTWGKRNWQMFCDEMARLNVFVVAVGKNAAEFTDHLSQDKPTFDIDLKFGLDLANQTTLEQTWHILNRATIVFTMDSGILHLAGTTDTHIMQLGSSVDPVFRAPYRKGTQSYKYNYIKGQCDIHCASNLKYSLRDWGGIQNVTLISTCLEPGMNYRCKPSVQAVLDEFFLYFNTIYF